MQAVKYRSYDVDAIKEIPLPDVLQSLNIAMDQYGKFKIRDEKTASCKFYKDTNSWYDFGSGIGGGTIDLMMAVMGTDRAQAIRTLGETFGIRELQTNAPTGKNLSLSQYESLGLDGSNALHNMKLPQSVKADSSIQRFAIPMNQLYDRHRGTYEQILKDTAVPSVIDDYNTYLYGLYGLHRAKLKGESLGIQLSEETARSAFGDYKAVYAVLSKAVTGTHIDIKKLAPDFDKDLEQIQKGRQSVQIGDFPYSEFKKLPGETKYIKVPEEVYMEFQRSGLQLKEPHSAYLQNGIVNVAVKESAARMYEDTFLATQQYIETMRPNVQRMQLESLEKDFHQASAMDFESFN